MRQELLKTKMDRLRVLKEQLGQKTKTKLKKSNYAPILADKYTHGVSCDVCLDGDYQDTEDELVSCSLCHHAVHQNCYGLGCTSDENWFCQRCTELKTNPEMKCTEIRCFLCPEVQGILKKVSENEKSDLWAHIICVNWMPEIWWEDEKVK